MVSRKKNKQPIENPYIPLAHTLTLATEGGKHKITHSSFKGYKKNVQKAVRPFE